eukprot:jgi/Tetstr1/423509/TSEL_014185.t1
MAASRGLRALSRTQRLSHAIPAKLCTPRTLPPPPSPCLGAGNSGSWSFRQAGGAEHPPAHRRPQSTRRCSATRLAAAGDDSGAPSGSTYWTLSEPHHFTLEVKKSKFVTTAWPVQSPSEAMRLVQTHGDPSASHNCFAYKVGEETRSSDDGEPGGTAGRPMLSALEGEGLDNVCVMVTRFFGGTKLGAGGLVRAYGGAARECLREAPRQLVKAKKDLRFHIPFELMGSCYTVLDRYQALRLSEDYTEKGSDIVVRVEAGDAAPLSKDLQDATSGAIQLDVSS